MKSLKYRGKIGRNVPFQDEKLSIVDEKIDEKKTVNQIHYIRFEEIHFNRFKHLIEFFWQGEVNTILKY